MRYDDAFRYTSSAGGVADVVDPLGFDFGNGLAVLGADFADLIKCVEFKLESFKLCFKVFVGDVVVRKEDDRPKIVLVVFEDIK